MPTDPSDEPPRGSAAAAVADALVETLRSTRLTVLTGRPGAGKSRLLRTHVLPRLRRRLDDAASSAPVWDATEGTLPVDRRRRTVRPRELVVFCDRWDGSPGDQVHARIDEATGETPPAGPRPPVALRAKALSAERGARVLFVFDHGDRIVASPSGAADPAADYDALVNALCSVSPSVHLLASARDDALPPSVQSRLGSPDTRRVSLPASADATGAFATARPAVPPRAAAAEDDRLSRDDVYASIADRLEAIAGRAPAPARISAGEAGGPAWAVSGEGRASTRTDAGDDPAPTRSRAGEARAPAWSSPGEGRAAVGEPQAPTVGRQPRRPAPDRVEPWLAPAPDIPPPAFDPVAASAPPDFVPGTFAQTAALRRTRSARRMRLTVGGLVLLLLAGSGLLLWQDGSGAGSWPTPSERRVAVAAERSGISPRSAPLPVPQPPRAASAPSTAIEAVEPPPVSPSPAPVASVFAGSSPAAISPSSAPASTAPVVAGAPAASLVAGTPAATAIAGMPVASAVALTPAASGVAGMPATSVDAGAPASAPVAPVAPVATEAPAASPARPRAPESAGETRLAEQLWREMSRHGVARIGVPTAVGTLDALSAGRRLAVVPYDALRSLARRGAGRSARVVAPLFAEEIHVVVRADSPLAFVHQLAGRRVDVGPPDGARHVTAVAFFERLFDRAPRVDELRAEPLDAALAELLDGGGGVDAILLVEPQPSAWLASLPAAQRRRLKLLAAAPDDPSTRRALRGYLPATVSAPLAGGTAVRGFSVMTFLVANPATPVGRDDTAALAAEALCRSLADLRRDGHPKWREVDPSLQLPVPLAYDPAAAAAARGCRVGAEAAARRPPLAVSMIDPGRPVRLRGDLP